jgi:AAA+ ATPase superfamily predicted ATPase
MVTLFDTHPKSDPKYLYGREKELNDLVGHVKNGDWVVLLGPRRVGKTSLARCTATKLGIRTLVIDARIESDFARGLTNGLSGPQTVNIQGSAAIPHVPVSVSAGYTKTLLAQPLEQLLSNMKKELLVIVDEAQWLKNPRGVARLMAHIFDYRHEKMTFVITGSAVGVMRTITEPGAKSPLYGRAMTTMNIRKWRDTSTSLTFLREGCKQNKVSLTDDELGDVVDTLDGVPGWLTLFGYHFSESKEAGKAMDLTRNEAMKIVKEELESSAKIALGWPRQLSILKTISKKSMKFNEIASDLDLPNKALSRSLDMLERLQYVEADEEKNYTIIDPIVREFMKRSE